MHTHHNLRHLLHATATALCLLASVLCPLLPAQTLIDTSTTIDGAGGAGTLNTVAAGDTVAYNLTNTATLTFTNNLVGASGGVFNMGAGANLLLSADAGSQYVFSNNNLTGSNRQGGVIYGTAYTLDITNALFTSNTSTGNGGAIFSSASDIKLTNASFTNNFVNGNYGGGAIAFGVGGGALELTNVFFGANTTLATGASFGGGAIFSSGTLGATITSATFNNNKTSSAGGAIYSNNTSIFTITDALITSNSAGTNGGGIYSSGNGSAFNLTDVSFLNNTAGANGGAISASPTATGSTTLNITVSAGSTSRYAGNTAGATPAPNSIYFASGSTALSVAVGAGGTLDMLDPMTAADVPLTITKTGAGAWNLGGTNTLGATTAAAVNFTVSGGALRLYRANATSAGYTVTTPGSLNLAGATSAFTLATGATLAIGGGNTIAANSITLAANSIITFDLGSYSTLAGAPLLTLTAPTLALNSDATTFNFALDFTNPAAGTYNLINGGATGIFATDGSAYNFASITGLDAFTYTDGITANTLWITLTALSAGSGSNTIIDGLGADTKRLIVPASTGTTLTLAGADTLTYTNHVTTANGGAANLSASSTLALNANGASRFLFTSNTSANGGAIFSSSGAVLTGNNLTFENNTTTGAGNGGAISQQGTATSIPAMTLNNVLFSGNTAGNAGGAISLMTSGTAFITSATFQNNVSSQRGGALFANNGAIYASLANVLFQSNTSGLANTGATLGGGAIMTAANASTLILTSATFMDNIALGQGGGAFATTAVSGIATFTNALFQSNTAVAGNGGAIFSNAASTILNLKDATFLDNTAQAGNGGAIYMTGGAGVTLNIAVSAGSTSRFAGNTAGATATPNSIYFTTGATTLTVDTAAGGTLDMLDPMAAADATLAITKTGAGSWNLAGDNTLGATTAAAVNFTVTGGALRLYRANTPSGPYTATTGNLNLAGGSFTLATGATLAVGGGNTIAAPAITLAANSIISFDLANYSTLAGAPLLTLAAPTLNLNSDAATFNFGLDFANAAFGTYNLINGSSGIFATDASNLNFASITGLDDYACTTGITNNTLWITLTSLSGGNNILTWTGAASALWLSATNWQTTTGGTASTFRNGDIVNLSAYSELGTLNPELITLTGAATVLGMNISGTDSYTIAGAGAITTNAAAQSTITADTPNAAAATGKLILGAIATDPNTLLTSDLWPLDAGFTGTLTLANTGSNNFTAGILINSGALVGNAANLGAGTVGIENHGALTFNQLATGTYASPITGDGALVKAGPAALTLTANSAAYTGTTTVATGALLLAPVGASLATPSPAALGGDIHVATGATFGGSGTAGTVTLAPGATLQIGLTTQDSGLGTPTLTLTSNLNLSDGSFLNYTALTNTLLVGGDLTLTGTSTINLATLTLGSYSIINAASGLSTLNTNWLDVNYNGNLLALGSDYTLTTDSAGLLWLNILNVPVYTNTVIAWTNAAGDQQWLGSKNWSAAGAAAQSFRQGDIINLAGTPAPDGTLTLNLATTATVAGMFVSGNQSYIITGGGGIVATTNTAATTLAGSAAANGRLILGAKASDDASTIILDPAIAAFTGVLDFTGLTANTFAGVDIGSGALRISTAAQLGAPLSNLTFLGSSLASSGTLLIATGGNVVFDGAGGATNRFALADSIAAAFRLEQSATMTIKGNTSALSGGALSVGAGSTLLLSAQSGAAFVFANNTAAAGGALAIAGANSTITTNRALFIGNTVTGNGGAISLTGSNTTLNLTDVSFLDNHAAGSGGAISYVMPGSSAGSNTAINLTVSAGGTSRFAGNTDSTGANSIYISYASAGTVSFNANIADGGTLDMLDPFKTAGSSAGAGFKFNKAGDGVWKLAGSSTIGKQGNTSSGDISIAQGELYLYGTHEAPVTDPLSGNTYTPAAASINFFNSNSANGNGWFNFTLSEGAILGIGGGNTITYTNGGAYSLAASTFTLVAGSILDFKLDNTAPESPAMLTVNASLLTAAHTNIIASGTLNPYLNLDFSDIRDVLGTYNLLSLTANGNSALGAITDFDSILANATFGPDGSLTASDLTALHFSANFGVTNNVLWVNFDISSATSSIVTWTGAAADTRWKGFNWADISDPASNQAFVQGDIANLDLAAATSNTISLNSAITAAGIFVSGNANYTITGPNPLNADATTIKDNLAGVAAATGKLILGAAANADGTINTTPYAGTLTLANTGTGAFVNGIDINSGALVGNAANLGVGPAAALNLAATGTLTFNQPTDATYTAPLNGAGALNKTGSGTLTLANATGAFTGPTAITAGGLLLDNNLALGGSVTAANATTFGGYGSVAGNATLGDNATLQVGTLNSVYESASGLTLGTLNIQGNLTLGSAYLLNYASVADTLHVAGNLAQTGAGTLNLQSLVSGNHNLGNIGSLNGNLSYTLNGATLGADSRVTFATDAGNNLIATVDMSRILYWTGATSGTWALTGADWDNRDTAAPINVFGFGDRVIFDDAGATAPIANIIPQGITASDIYVTAATDYTFTGGALTTDPASALAGAELGAGSGALYKAGSGTLTLANAANNFIGGIQLLGGVLNIADNTTAGAISNIAANTTLQITTNGTLNAANLQLADAATLAGNGALTGAATLNGLVNAAIAASNTLTITAAVNGAGGYLKTGAGTLELNGRAALRNTGATQLDQGLLNITGISGLTTTTGANMASTVRQTITLNGGNLALNGDGSALGETTANDWTGLTLLQGAAAAASIITGVNDIIYLGSGTFAPSIQGGIIPVIAAGNAAGATAVLTNTTSNFTGLIRVDSGTLQVTDPAALGGLTGSGTKVALNGGALQISAPLTTTRGLEVRATTNTVVVDAGVASTWNSIYYSGTTSADFTKAGSGTLTVTSANFQATSLTVAAGRFIGNNVATVPNYNGVITVEKDAAFELNITSPASNYTALINNPIVGSGTFEVTSGGFTLSAPEITVANINITGASSLVGIRSSTGNSNFGPDSKITISNGAVVALISRNLNFGNVTLKDGGRLSFAFPTTSANTDFATATFASLVSSGSNNTLNFGANLALGLSDHMTVTGETSGDFAVTLTNFGAVPSQYNGAIHMIDFPAKSAATFNPLTPTIDMGLYKYTISTVTNDNGMSLVITGSGAMSNAAALIYSTAALMPLSWFTELDSVGQRLGDLRFENRETAAGIATWTRGYGEKTNYNNKATGAPFGEQRMGVEAGLDYKFGGVATNIYAGAFFGYGQSQRNYNTAGDGSSENYFAGLYATVAAPSGLYFDAVLKANNFTNHFNAIAPSGASTRADFTTVAAGLSLELGKNFNLDYGWYFTPKIQGAVVAATDNTYQTDTGITVAQTAGGVLQGKAGFEFGRIFETSKYGTIHAYVKAAALTQRTRGSKMTITLPDNPTSATYAPAIAGDSLMGGVGAAWLYSKRTQIYCDFETSQAAYYIKPWNVNLGIRYNW